MRGRDARRAAALRASLFISSESGPNPAWAGAGGPEGNGRFKPEAPKGRILVNGLGCGTGRLPGESGCDILELRIWYKNRGTAAGLALPDVGAERILFF